MSVMLKAEDVSIRYITGDFKEIGIKEYTVRKLTGNYHVKEFMAVDGVSFELEEGDMLGIIGANGAGKSTLLKAVAGIMEPTRGKITANGEVAALLELGSGFDGDLTVRENAYLRGAMLGYTKEFMDQTYDRIIEFAELEEFQDRPFKQLSSGMKSRLAFSIASLVSPDILILDEVLSVGDGAFQEKSAKKMREIISQGATTILVSHSLNQIKELCNKVLWLDHGKQIAFGRTEDICDQYHRFLQGESLESLGLLPEQKEIQRRKADTPELGVSPKYSKKDAPHRLKAVSAALVMAAFAALVGFMATEHIIWDRTHEETVQIYSASLGEKPVTYRGAADGGNWYSPSDTVTSAGNWSVDWDQMTYTATDDSPLVVKLPRSSGRTLTFNAGPDQGKAKIVTEAEAYEIDLCHPETVALGLPHDLPDSAGVDGRAVAFAVAAAAFVLIGGLSYSIGRAIEKKHCGDASATS